MMWKRPVRWLLYGLCAVTLAVVAGMLVPRPLWSAEKTTTDTPTHRILVLSNPIHTDIAIRLDAETRSRFSFLEDSGMPLAHPDARWLIFGWGGRAFYIETPTWADLKPLPLMKGLTIDRSVMHVGIAGEIAEPADYITGFDIDSVAHAQLLSFIEASFVRGEGGVIDAIPDAGYGANDRFFAANGWFSAVVGCNTWTAGALRAAGIRTGWWNPLPKSLVASLELYN